VQLLDRKAKLLGMDAPSKVEAPPVVAPETEEQRTRAREALKTWTKFCIDPKDFQVKGLRMITVEGKGKFSPYMTHSGSLSSTAPTGAA